MEFPFAYGQIVTGSQFIDRKKELSRLKTNINHGIHTVLISPRGWGKSTLMNNLAKKLSKDKNLKFVFIDLLGQADELDFFREYSKEVLKTAISGLENPEILEKKSLRSLQQSITIENVTTGEFNISMEWEDLEKNYDRILDLPEKLAKKKRKYIICIKEFQRIEKFKNNVKLQSWLKSVWQHHKHVIYLLCGSSRAIMEKIFLSQSNPFFNFAEIMYLSKIKKKYFSEYIISTFEKSGKIIPKDRADKMIDMAGKVPYFVQQLAQLVWMRSSEMVIESDIQSAVKEIVSQNGIWYLREVERMTPPQFNYLKAVVNKEQNLSGQEVLKKYRLGSSANVAKIKKVMEEREILDYRRQYPEFIDPFFRLWIEKNNR